MSDSFAFHAADGRGGEGYVVLLFRPAAGRVAWREWPSEAYMAPGREGSSTVEELEERVAGWKRRGWTLSESPQRISAWLRSG